MTTLKLLMTAAFVLAIILGAFAIAYQAPGGPLGRSLLVAVWLAAAAIALAAVWRGDALASSIVLSLMLIALALWWRSILPSNERDWADDVARIAHAEVVGDAVTVHDVRNFDWRSDTDYTVRWETRRYDLVQLRSADMILSYWNGPAIAHVLISFGFDDGRYLAFSVEIRREKSESFSGIGGFFKQFELAIIAADEADIVRVRTNVRGEDDFLYRLQLPDAELRSLFLAYLDEAGRLRGTPRFYNSATVNCTTLVYHMMQRIVGGLPWSYRLLLSGYLPGYVFEQGGLDRAFTLDQLRRDGRITARARAAAAADSMSFSAAIRRGVPGIAWTHRSQIEHASD